MHGDQVKSNHVITVAQKGDLWAPQTDTSSGRPAVSVMLPRIDVRMTTTRQG